MAGSVEELKARIHRSIENTDDPSLLETVSELLHARRDDQSPIQLSPEQAAGLAEAREQIRRGETLTAEEADAVIARWLAE